MTTHKLNLLCLALLFLIQCVPLPAKLQEKNQITPELSEITPSPLELATLSETIDLIDAISSNIPVHENIVEKQWEQEREILLDYQQGDYSLEQPYLLLNPYDWSPLTALLLFHSQEKAKVTLTIQGKDPSTQVTHQFENFDTFHQIPVLGLYSDHLHQLDITLTFDDGSTQKNTIQIQTPALELPTPLIETSLSQPSQVGEGFLFLSALGQSALVIDPLGQIRWILDLPQAHVFQRLENGNILVKTEDGTGFYEMDMLGKVFTHYQDVNQVQECILELPNGNFLLASTHDQQSSHRIIELDRETGAIVWDFDLSTLLSTKRYGDSTDWFHLNAMVFDEGDQSLILSGLSYGLVKISYPTGKIQWILTPNSSLELDGDTYLLPTDPSFQAPTATASLQLLPDQDGDPDSLDILLFDSNSPLPNFANYTTTARYSQSLQLRIHETQQTIQEINSYAKGKGSSYYAPLGGSAFLLENGNFLSSFAGTAYSWGSQAKIQLTDPLSQAIYLDFSLTFPQNSHLTSTQQLPLYPNFWEYELRSIKGVVMAKNQQDRYQSQLELSPLPQNDPLLQSPAPSQPLVQADFYLDESYQTIDITGTISAQDQPQQLALLFQSATDSYTIPLSLQEEETEQIQHFALALPYETLELYLSEGLYTLSFLISQENQSFLQECPYYYTVEKERFSLENGDLLSLQNIISQAVLLQFEQDNYSQESPMVLLNPYGIAPLTALVAFSTPVTGTMEVTIQGNSPSTEIVHKFSALTDYHFLPIYGLYPEKNNEITLRFINELGESTYSTLFIETNALPSQVANSQVLTQAQDSLAPGFTFVTQDYLCAYDQLGDLRWYLDLQLASSSELLLLENGHLAVLGDKFYDTDSHSTSFYELDFLGKIYHEYLVNGSHHQIQELSNGDFLLSCDQSSANQQDYFILLDRDTGEMKEDWDMKEILELLPKEATSWVQSQWALDFAQIYPNLSSQECEILAQEKAQTHWLDSTAFYFQETSDTLLLLATAQDAILEFDCETHQLLWVLSHSQDHWLDAYPQALLQGEENTSFPKNISHFQKLENGNLLLSASVSTEYGLETMLLEYEIQPETMTFQEITRSPTSGSGAVQVLDSQHYLLCSDKKTSEIKLGTTLFSLAEQNATAKRYPFYASNTHYLNPSQNATRLGSSSETPYSHADLPSVTNDLDFTIDLAMDQGDRIALNFMYHNYVSGEKFLILQNKSAQDIRCYSTRGEEDIYINKAGLHQGYYEIGTLIIDRNGDSHFSQTDFVLEIPVSQVSVFVPSAVTAQLQQAQLHQAQTGQVTSFFLSASLISVFFLLFYLKIKGNKPKSK